MNPLRRLLQEIHRRSLWQVLLVYVAVSWAVIEAIQGLTEATGLPEWFPSFAVWLLVIGFPIVLGTAFVQKGMRRREAIGEALDKPMDAALDPAGLPTPRPAPERIERLFTWRNAILGGVLAFAIWGAIAVFWILVLGRSGGSRP